MRTAVVYFVIGFNYFVGGYFAVLNTVYTLLLTIALFSILRHIRRVTYAPIRDFRHSPQTPPVSILMPVYNEERIIIRSIKSALAIEYPLFEVLIINDGSTDGTLQTIIEAFHLKKIDRVYRPFLETLSVNAFYYSNATHRIFSWWTSSMPGKRTP